MAEISPTVLRSLVERSRYEGDDPEKAQVKKILQGNRIP